MANPLTAPRWSPYAVGAGIGVLSWITFAWMGKALGTSTTLVRAAGAIEGTISEQHVRETEYLAKYIVGKPVVDWQFALVIALALGAGLAALLGRRAAGGKFVETVPGLWAWRFGKSKALRYTAAFTGGAILLFGARMAGGCTSGHAISGGLQLAVSSWIFTIAMFITGIITAFALFGGKGRSHV
ncbi:MAG: YeeE/YedE thiosulfate transporter family protein [Phycisphaerales bacterium]